METKLFLVVDNHAAYRDYQIDRILEDWGTERKDIRVMETFTTSCSADLFGVTPVSMITFLNNLDGLKTMIQQFVTMDKDSFNNSFPEGLIIVTDAKRVSTKKLETHVKTLGGTMSLMTPENESQKVSLRLANEMKLRKPVKDFLLSYVGDDYETLIPLVRSITKLEPRYQQKITEEDLLIRLPLPKGAIKPWEVRNHMTKGDVNGTIESARRVFHHSHYLVLLTMLRNQYQNMYRLRVLMDVSSDNDTVKEVTGAKNLTYLKRDVKNLSVEQLEQIVETIATTETNVKGGSYINGETLVELMLIDIMKISGTI